VLIAVAGGIGAGKSTVARALADRLGLPLHSIDDDKRALGATTPEFDHWVRAGIPFPDDFRVAVYQRTLGALEELARTHPHVIVEETFHRKAIRDPFFDRAGQLLGGFVLIEVVANHATIVDRLARRAGTEADHLAGVAMHRAFLDVSDTHDRTGFAFANDADFDAEVDRCVAHLAALVTASTVEPRSRPPNGTDSGSRPTR
jgi:predicted kinase